MFYKENTLTILNISENCNSLIEAIGLGIFNESEDKIYQLESSIISDPIDILDSIPSKNETSVLESSIIFEPTNNNIGQTTILEVTENLQSNTNTETTIVIKSTNPIIVPSSIVSSTILSSNIISDSLFLGKIEEERIYIKKENLFDEIPYILETIEIEKIYKKIGDDFSILIYPTTSTFDSRTTYIIFSECESILREHYKIPNSTITFFQIEIENNNSKSLINQVEYQAYDGKKPLNLSLCNDTSIEMLYAIKNNSLVDFNSVNQFMKSGIDIFNINDSFFNDICEPYLNSNDDLILEDRIKYIYQNYSLCEEGCTYNKIILENMTISCQCKVKENISLVINPIEFEEVERSSTNFDVVKCYKLVFSLKGKLNNIGFLIFSILVISHIPLLIYFFNKGIKPIKNYVFNEMKKYGYIKDKNLKSKNKKNHSSPPKNKNNNNQKKYIIKNLKIIDNSSSVNILKSSKRLIIPRSNITNQLNNKDNNKNKRNNENKQIKNTKKLKKNTIKAKNKIKKGTFVPNKIISNIETQNNYQYENKKNSKLKTFSFINIDLKLSRNRKYFPPQSHIILNNYTFEEAIKYDKRQTCVIFYIFALSKQFVFHTFLFRSPLELFSLRLCLFIFIFSTDLALNALFYFNENISKKYRYAKNLFLFTFSDNITIILLSTFVGFILLGFLGKLSNTTNAIRDVFRKEEEKLKKNKKYIVTQKRKNEIFIEIEEILNKYKIKVIIFIIIELILMIFFWYFVTAFCHVYNSTQISWLLDSFLSILFTGIIELLISFGLAKLYRIAIAGEIHCLYKILMFLYNFS